MKSPAPIRRLFFDIETSPNVVLSWRIGWKININHENLLKERAIICIGYKWQGDKKAKVLAWDKQQSDRGLLTAFAPILAEADEAIGHNIDKFDMPWVKTRCVYHGINLPPVKTADTLQWARRKMLFNSNRLDYIASFLGIGGKIKTDFKLWKSILLNHDDVALDKMKRYCAWDVELLEKVWQKLSMASPVKTHAGVLVGRDTWSCPRCASEDVKKVRKYVTARGVEQQQLKCNVCGGYHNVSMKAREAYEAEKRRPRLQIP